MVDFYFNPSTQRYHRQSTGRFLSKNKIKEIVGDYLESQKAIARKTNQRLFEDKITLAQWEESQAKFLKNLAVQLFKIGHPELGDHFLDNRYYGMIGNRLRTQYGYLRGFSRDIADETQSQAQINARMDMYISASRFYFEEGKREAHKSNGYLWERRVLAIAEHCPDCPRYAALSWQSIGSLPAITTQCQCGPNDKCFFEYSKSLTRPVTNMLQNSFGWIA
ncbi:hypothetical protein [Crocosphaera sp.]|uniref:hypothetical protein n=1 Tax=Crocosphaera sp. TaxID=2729996 RepID=UPI002639A9F4|nr:hypothetical protein [Crocosphaera sp.]MDJ0579094.1 hypothetical protein [Crocosphaera sp.]